MKGVSGAFFFRKTLIKILEVQLIKLLRAIDTKLYLFLILSYDKPLNGVTNKKWFLNNLHMISFIYKFYENFEGLSFANLKRAIKNLILYEQYFLIH